MRLDGFGFDLEVLFLAQKMNYKIKEIAVNWTHVGGSKINLAKDSLIMLSNIIQIRQWHGGKKNKKNEPNI
jgi:dolichyl-phosphate beta-glucosyltransferase